MAKQLTLTNISDLQNTTTSQTNINNNNAAITTAFEDVLSLSGVAPNQMQSVLDMNSNQVINVGAPSTDDSAARLIDIKNISTIVSNAAAIATAVTECQTAETAAAGSATAAAASAASITSIGNVLLASRTVAEGTSINSGVEFIITGGYATQGDGGGASYYKTSGSTTGGFQSADLAWWALASEDINIMMLGALTGSGNASVTTTAINNAISIQQSRGGGRVIIPGGSWWVSSSISIANGNSVDIIGSGEIGTTVSVTGDFAALNVQAPYCLISEITFYGYNNVAATTPTINLQYGTSGGSVGSKITHCSVYNGLYGILVQTGDVIIEDVYVTAAYLYSIYILGANTSDTAQAWLRRVKLDNAWVGLPYNTALSAWSTIGNGGTATNGQIFTVTQAGRSYLLQCTLTGTTGNSQPVVVSFGATITDGTANWTCLGNAQQSALVMDSNTEQVHAEQCDFSGLFGNAIQMLNSLSQTAPYGLFISDSSFGDSPLYSGINAAAGGYLNITGCELSGTAYPSSYVIVLGTSWVGPAVINSNIFYGNRTQESTAAVYAAAGANTIVSSNFIGAQGAYGVLVAGGISNFNISNNIIASCPTGVYVASGGSNNYIIQNNITNTCSTGIFDGGSGSTKSIQGVSY